MQQVSRLRRSKRRAEEGLTSGENLMAKKETARSTHQGSTLQNQTESNGSPTGAFPTINDAMKNILERQVDMEEDKTATFDIGAYKAPGPDGIHGIFYHSQWEQIQPSLNFKLGARRAAKENISIYQRRIKHSFA